MAGSYSNYLGPAQGYPHRKGDGGLILLKPGDKTDREALAKQLLTPSFALSMASGTGKKVTPTNLMSSCKDHLESLLIVL